MLPSSAYRLSLRGEQLYDRLLSSSRSISPPTSPREKTRTLEYDSGDISKLRRQAQASAPPEHCLVCRFPQTPRSALPPDKEKEAAFVSPFTDNLVILNRQVFPQKVITDLQFQNPLMHNSLVREFEYSRETGEIFYDIKERDNLDTDEYARVMTLNSWYQELSVAFLSAALGLMDVYANLMFSAGLISRRQNLGIHLELPLLFTLVFLVLEVTAIAQAYSRARAEMSKPDLFVGKDLNMVDRHYVLHALALFYYLGINSMVRDIIVWLHPFKNVQPYAAAKADGKRFYLLGFASEYMFRCDANVGQDVLWTTQVSVRLVLVSLKIGLSVKTWDFTSGMLCVPTLIFMAIKSRSIKALIADQEVHWAWLNQRWAELERIRRDAGVDDAQRRKTLVRQKRLHFAEEDWGGEFQGWRNLRRRSSRIVRMVSALAVFLFLDIWVAGLGIDHLGKVYSNSDHAAVASQHSPASGTWLLP